MEAIFLKLVNLSITAGWLVLAVMLVRLVFRRVPKWIYCILWGLVAIRLICPVSLESALSLIPSAEPLPAEKGDGSVILYQGAVNVGRGVREVADAMEYLPQCRFVVAGDGDELEAMRHYVAALPWHDRITLLGRVEPERLHRLTVTADLGICLLEDRGLNSRYSLPNRIADFAMAGVPILATDFPEIHRVLEEYGTGTLTEPCPTVKSGEAYRQYIRRLADTLTQTLDHWATMPAEEKQRRFARAGEELCWEREKNILIEAVNVIFNKKQR